MTYFILFTVIIALCIGANDRGCGIKCFSFGCRHNRCGRCGSKEMVVYDNTVKGLCLYHTESMKERILDPMQKSELLDRHGSHKIASALKTAQEYISDIKLLKNPDTFAKWIKRRLR